MPGFKHFDTAAITISGVEKIRKHQSKSGDLAGEPKTVPANWAAGRLKPNGVSQQPPRPLGNRCTRASILS
jgi:hypothetical protein